MDQQRYTVEPHHADGKVGQIERQPMRAFMVCFKQGGAVVRSFEAMGTDSCTVVEQHLGSCQPGEKLDVMSLEAWREVQEPQPFTEDWFAQVDRQVQRRKDTDAQRQERELRALHEQMDRRPA